MNRTRLLVGAASAILLLIISILASPYWQLDRMRTAIENDDYEAITDRVDFPSLRENIKARILATILDQIQQTAEDNPFAGFGQAMAVSLVNPMVDAMMSPAGLMAMLKNGRIQVKQSEAASNLTSEREKDFKFVLTYRNWNTLAVSRSEIKDVSLIFKRHGLWTWKLSDVEVPRS